MNKKIIPCQPKMMVYYEAKDENGNDIPATGEDGRILLDDNGRPVGTAIPAAVHYLALVEDCDGSRCVEPVISMGEYMGLLEHYINVYMED